MEQLYESNKRELDEAREELAEIEAMTDEQACYIYNVDSKSEIIEIISQDIKSLEGRIKDQKPFDLSTDPAIEIFGNYGAMNTFLY